MVLFVDDHVAVSSTVVGGEVADNGAPISGGPTGSLLGDSGG